MTNSPIAPIIALAAASALSYFTDDLIHYTDPRNTESIRDYIDNASADDLADAIAIDLHDLLHHANLDAIFPDAIAAALSDDDLDNLLDALLDNCDAIAATIAATIFAMIPS